MSPPAVSLPAVSPPAGKAPRIRLITHPQAGGNFRLSAFRQPPAPATSADLNSVQSADADFQRLPKFTGDARPPRPTLVPTTPPVMSTPPTTSAAAVQSRGGGVVSERIVPLARPTPPPGVQLTAPPIDNPAHRANLDHVTLESTAAQTSADQGVSLVATDADLVGVLRMIADHHGLNLVVGPNVRGVVTVQIRQASLDEVLDAIVGIAGFHWHRKGSLLFVSEAQRAVGTAATLQGRYLQVYNLNYVAAEDVEAVVQGLLTPMGTAHIVSSDPNDQLKSSERLIVEDVPATHELVSQLISQMDVSPRQVLVEVHLLQVTLDDRNRQGIDLEALARLGSSRFRVTGTGFTETSTPSMSVQIDGNDMDGLIEMIEQTNNARTLASPKLSVVNQQEARIQIGRRLPYTVQTINQAVAIESVEYLDVGIVLIVRPSITDDGRVLMTLSPKVSDGIPVAGSNDRFQEDTTELQTTILMGDGEGVIIGGLIRERNVDEVARVPVLGRIPWVGNLFTKKSRENARDELIIALVAHLMPPCGCTNVRQHEQIEASRVIPLHAEANTAADPHRFQFPLVDSDLAK